MPGRRSAGRAVLVGLVSTSVVLMSGMGATASSPAAGPTITCAGGATGPVVVSDPTVDPRAGRLKDQRKLPAGGEQAALHGAIDGEGGGLERGSGRGGHGGTLPGAVRIAGWRRGPGHRDSAAKPVKAVELVDAVVSGTACSFSMFVPVNGGPAMAVAPGETAARPGRGRRSRGGRT